MIGDEIGEIKNVITNLSKRLKKLTDNNNPVNISRNTFSRSPSPALARNSQEQELPAMTCSYKKTLHVNCISLYKDLSYFLICI